MFLMQSSVVILKKADAGDDPWGGLVYQNFLFGKQIEKIPLYLSEL